MASKTGEGIVYGACIFMHDENDDGTYIAFDSDCMQPPAVFDQGDDLGEALAGSRFRVMTWRSSVIWWTGPAPQLWADQVYLHEKMTLDVVERGDGGYEMTFASMPRHHVLLRNQGPDLLHRFCRAAAGGKGYILPIYSEWSALTLRTIQEARAIQPGDVSAWRDVCIQLRAQWNAIDRDHAEALSCWQQDRQLSTKACRQPRKK